MKRLYRSRNDRMLAGVCGGFGEYTGVDPTLIRVGLMVAAVFTAVIPLSIVYVVAWAIIPERPE
ncbi:MAG: PspC domain-containing protein [Candidatus Bipolaricaulota bacterium]